MFRRSHEVQMSPVNFVRLAIMMFLQFFMWGAWYVTAPRYLGQIGFDGAHFGWTYSVGPLAGMLSPFFVGMIADRFLATERVLGILHLLGSVTMFGATLLMRPDEPAQAAIILLFFAHMLCYYPTLALTNSLAMNHISDTEKVFPLIRVFGTIGWIAAGILLWLLNWGASIHMFQLAAATGLLLGVYCFTLPHTPPPARGKKVTAREILGMDALVLLKRPSFAIFMACSFAICIPLAFYYQLAERTLAQGIPNPEQAPFFMTFGQMSEIFFMLAMPLFFARLGVKWMLFVGMLAWVVRYVLFAIGAPDQIMWMLLAGVILHGICYDFFFVTGQIYTDKAATRDIRAQAQGLLVFCTLGLGMLIGAQVGGQVEKAYTPAESKALSADVQKLNAEIERLIEAKKSTIDLERERDKLHLRSLQLIDWRSIWTIPAIGAGIIMLIFALIFRDDTKRVTNSEVKEIGGGAST